MNKRFTLWLHSCGHFENVKDSRDSLFYTTEIYCTTCAGDPWTPEANLAKKWKEQEE